MEGLNFTPVLTARLIILFVVFSQRTDSAILRRGVKGKSFMNASFMDNRDTCRVARYEERKNEMVGVSNFNWIFDTGVAVGWCGAA